LPVSGRKGKQENQGLHPKKGAFLTFGHFQEIFLITGILPDNSADPANN
jgi:hypothetical protein